jgi:hypothetical protein
MSTSATEVLAYVAGGALALGLVALALAEDSSGGRLPYRSNPGRRKARRKGRHHVKNP